MKRFLALALWFATLNAHALEAPKPALDDLISPDEIAQEVLAEPALTPEEAIGESSEAPLQFFAAPRVFIAINKAPHAQYMTVYVDSRHYATWPVSTGREGWERPPSGRSYYSGTPTGTWTPYVLRRNHWSRTWGVSMPYAIFITGGIAIHAAAPDYNSRLGSRASGGCIRLEYGNAQTLYSLVSSYGRTNTRVQIYSR